jgi:hypothetical protein
LCRKMKCHLRPQPTTIFNCLALSTWAPHCSANFPDGLLKRFLVRALIAWWSPKPVPVDRAGPTIMSAEPESSARRAGRMPGESSSRRSKSIRESFKLVQGADAVSVAEGNMDRRDRASACSALRGLRTWACRYALCTGSGLDEEWENTFRRWLSGISAAKLNRRLRERICPRNLTLSDTNARFEDANGPFFHGLAAIRSRYVRQPPGRFLTL